MKEPPSSTKRPPALDEVSFQKLLEAAFVLQEHNQRQRGNESQPDLNASLSAIVETHNLIQTRQLDFRTAVSLVAEQAQRMTGASGVAVGVLQTGQLAYHAATGTASGDAATLVPIESSLSAECLLEGKLVQYVDLATASSPGVRAGGSRGIRSLVAAPVYHKGKIAGVLELRFAKLNSFQNRDVGTAQLMAGLVSEVMLVADALELKQPVTSERKALLDALGKIGPGPNPTTAESPPPPRVTEAAPVSVSFEPAPVNPVEDGLREAYAETCTGCGNSLEEGEAFCGQCGMARPGRRGGSTQSKLASLWRMQQAAEKNRSEEPLAAQPPTRPTALKPSAVSSPRPGPAAKLPPVSSQNLDVRIPAPPSRPPSLTPPDAPVRTQAWPGSAVVPASNKEVDAETSDLAFGQESTSPPVLTSVSTSGQAEAEIATRQTAADAQEPIHPIRIVPDEVSGSPVPAKSAWTSARKTREWLDAVKAQRRPWAASASHWWRRYRANVYVALAALIFSISVVMLIASPNHDHTVPDVAASGAHRRKAPPPPEMTLFEKFLVGLGLAEPPDAPAYMGNPNTRVWVDLHTALYYCPGAELYGKTEGGKFTTQRDAQQDQFEPASRKVCE
jgi:hypothetical protein